MYGILGLQRYAGRARCTVPPVLLRVNTLESSLTASRVTARASQREREREREAENCVDVATLCLVTCYYPIPELPGRGKARWDQCPA